MSVRTPGRAESVERPPADRFTGCLLGLALGDALGAPFEGGPIERAVWRIIGRTRDGRMRWTDDTQMSLDLAESLVANRALDLDDLAARFAKSYRWSRGYGPGAAKLLRRIEIWGAANGASSLPERLLGTLEDRARIETVAGELYRVSASTGG